MAVNITNTMIMVDCRCPKCDRIVKGRQEVSIVKSVAAHKKIVKCPKCDLDIKLVEDTDDIGVCWFYESVSPIVWGDCNG
jgi:hypothetical protein